MKGNKMKRMITGNHDKLWRLAIATAPAHLLARELTQNGFDGMAQNEKRKVKWDSVLIDGVPKLAIVDDAKGMSLDELTKFSSEMSWSGEGRSNDTNGNHGVGSRMVGLKSHPYGMVYYTKQAGKPTYSATLAMDKDGCAVCKVEPHHSSSPLYLGDHGTAVILMGESADQNTVLDPWVGAKKIKSNLMESLANRYFRFPAGAEVRLDKSVSVDATHLKVMPIQNAMSGSSERYEVVNLPNGIKLHFALFELNKDRKRKKLNSIHFKGMGGVVWQNEIYYSSRNTDWINEAANFRLESVADKLFVFVELPEGFPALATQDRSRLEWLGENGIGRNGYRADRTFIQVKNFTGEIAKNLPRFVLDLIKEKKSEEGESMMEKARESLRNLMRKHNLRIEQFIKDRKGSTLGGEIDGVSIGDEGEEKTKTKSKVKPIRPNIDGTTPSSLGLTLANLPDVRIATAETDVPIAMVKTDDAVAFILYEKHTIVAAIKENARKLYNVLSTSETEFEDEWQRAAKPAAMESFGKAYLALVMLSKSGWSAERIAPLMELDASVTAISHIFEFEDTVIKHFERIAKMALTIEREAA